MYTETRTSESDALPLESDVIDKYEHTPGRSQVRV